MNVHANAALSLNKRRLLCERGGRGCRGQRPVRAQVGAPLRLRG